MQPACASPTIDNPSRNAGDSTDTIPAAERTAERCRSLTRPRTHKTLRTLIWVVALLGIGETVVRVRAWHRHGTAGPVADIYVSDDLLGRRLRPGATLHGSNRDLTINRWGFRGEEIPLTKPPNTVRVAVVGDSTTFGMEASSDQAVWVARMITRLNADQTGPRHDVLNGAVPGYTLAASTTQLTEEITPFDPDIVVVYQVGTDIAAHARRQLRPAATGNGSSPTVTKFLQEKSLLFNLLRVNTTAFSSKRLPQRRHDRLDDRGVEQYAQRLRKAVETCRRNGWRAVLCTCPRAFGDETAPTDQYTLAASALDNNPWLSVAGLSDAYTRYNDAVRQVANETGAALADLDQIVPKRRVYFADSVHLNDAGHELVGEAVANVVMELETHGSLAVR